VAISVEPSDADRRGNAYTIGGISLVAVAQIDLFGAFCGVIAGRSAGP